MLWKLQENKRKGSRGRQGRKEQAGYVYLGFEGLALGTSLFWQRLLAVCWGRASQTANERFLCLGTAISLPSGWGQGTCWPQVDLSLHGTMHVSVRLKHNTALLPREPPSGSHPL